MAELFGAPLGIIAKQEGNQQEMLRGLTAQKMLGDIEAQPTELAYKRQLGSLHAADAALKMQEVGSNAAMLRLQSDWAEQEARGGLADKISQTEGRVATTADVPKGGAAKAWSPATKLIELAQFAEARKVPPQLLTKLYESIAGIQKEEGVREHNTAQAAERRYTVESKERDELGGAAAAAASSPENYARISMFGGLPQEILKKLTGNYATDRKALQYLADSTRTAQQQADQARQAQELKLSGARVATSQAKANAYIQVAKARVDRLKQDADILEKTAGPKTQAYIDKLKTTSEAQRELTVAWELRNYPTVPLKAADRELGKVYTGSDGTRFRYHGVNEAGVPLWTNALKDAQAAVRASGTAPLDPPPGDD